MTQVTTAPDTASNGENPGEDPSRPPRLMQTTKSLAKLEAGISHYPEEIREQVRWLQGFFLDHCSANFHALTALVSKVGGGSLFEKSAAYFNNLIGGYYFSSPSSTWKKGGKAWTEFSDMIEALHRYAQNAARIGMIPFVETPTYRCIADFITSKRALSAVCKFGGITGPTGAQKSECLKRYRDLNNHGAVVHFEAPARPTIGALTVKLAACYHATGKQIQTRAVSRENEIRENVNNTRCIIIDNAQRLYNHNAGSNQPCFNYLLELQDDTRCTIILSFTEEFLKGDLTAGAAKAYFEQFLGRMGGLNNILRLPEWTPAADLRVIAKSFGLDAGKKATEFLDKWSKLPGRVRIVFDKLQTAQTFARIEGRDRITLEDMAGADVYVPPSTGSDGEGGAS